MYLAAIGSSNTNKSIIGRYTNNQIEQVVYSGVVSAHNKSSTALLRGDCARIIGSIAENNFALSASGRPTVTDSSGIVPSGFSTLLIGGGWLTSMIGGLNGCALNIIYYQKRLANSVIEANSKRENSND